MQASLAQLVEHRSRKAGVISSSLIAGSIVISAWSEWDIRSDQAVFLAQLVPSLTGVFERGEHGSNIWFISNLVW